MIDADKMALATVLSIYESCAEKMVFVMTDTDVMKEEVAAVMNEEIGADLGCKIDAYMLDDFMGMKDREPVQFMISNAFVMQPGATRVLLRACKEKYVVTVLSSGKAKPKNKK